jgi:hypothetical protein
MFARIKYKLARNPMKTKGKKTRNFFTFNKLRNGVKIIKIKPTKLLIKNLGYLDRFVQKSLIKI